MQINITIEKQYLWLLILAVVAVGFVIAYNTDPANPSVMGHSYEEVEGVPVNCFKWSTDSACQALNNAPGGGWTARGAIAAYSAYTYNSERINGRQIRLSTQTIPIANSAVAQPEVTFSPACPDNNYQVFLTAKRMPGSGAVYVPVMGDIVDADTFTYTLFDIQGNRFTGNVDVNMLIFCSS